MEDCCDILHINSYYVSRDLYKHLYDYQKNLGMKIRVYVPVEKKIVLGDFERGDYTDISYIYNKTDRYIFHSKHLKIYKDLKRYYCGKKVKLVHAHSLFSNGYVALLLKKNFGIPYVVTVQNTDVNFFYKKLPYLRYIGNMVLNEAKSIFFISESYKNEVIDKYIPSKIKNNVSEKSNVIPFGIDRFWIDNLNTDIHELDDKHLKILSVGEIIRNKNQKTTIKVCQELINRGFDVKFTIIGEIIDHNIYKDLISYDFVEFHPFMPKEKLISYYRENDIFVMPSITETFGLVYAEAISQGLPIIYTKGQGFDLQFKNGEVGLAVNPIDVNDMVNAIEFIIKNYKQIRQACIEKIHKFDWNNICERYMSIYELNKYDYEKSGGITI